MADENGTPYNFKTSNEGNNKRIKIGDADKFVTGQKTYVINYRIRRAINYFGSRDELYWNATGNEWPVAIQNAAAEIILPAKIESDSLQAECFAGVFGSTERCEYEFAEKDGHSAVVYSSAGPLSAGEGLTAVLGFPGGIISKPPFYANWLYALKDNLILFLPLAAFAILFWRWNKYGKDPAGAGTIIAQFEAPEKMTPLEVGTVIDERVNNKDISAQIIYYAAEGYLTIRKIKEKKLIFSAEDYELEKLRDFSALENEFDKKLLAGIFGEKSKVKLADLKDKFHKDLAEVRKKAYESAAEKGYFAKNPNLVRIKYFFLGLAVFFLSFFFAAAYGAWGMISGIASAAVIIIFGFIMPRKTKMGVSAKEHILGLKEYLSVAEKDRIKFHNAPAKNPQTFEKLLPYAMVLGVEKEWAAQFSEIYQNQNPAWYSDASGGSFNSLLLAGSLSSFSTSASATLSSAPSSAAGGGSGFSGGGSGGGFGGGGGGSW